MIGILKSFYRKFNKNYQAEFLNKKEFDYFTDCKKILDLGCGVGNFILQEPSRIIGIDSNKKSIALCKKRGLRVKFGNVTKIPFQNNTFDGIHASHIIEHLYPKDAHNMLNEVGRVLKKDGIFVLSTPILWSGFYNDFTHIKPYNPESIIRYICDEGKEKTFSDIPYKFKLVHLEWRFRPLYVPGKVGYLVSNYLYTLGVRSYSKDGYTLVLKKIDEKNY